ncbi:uncharacterized protein LAJ45_11112 [Morchella importuna]|uniref:uncharacterized protein n=1 Tax=Morchella importuna TaxID=1174673 RepID=UPI001E8CAEEB|nr:uncharacterized protein LAJ45_11112 [Morchella importuna]KAH8144906.1 hypothetical protein LAJ45_11112 [Morchella importuna]
MQFLTNLALAALAILPVFGSPVPSVPKAGDIVPDSYIVVLNEGVSDAAFQAHTSWASSVNAASMKKRGLEPRAETFDYTYTLGSLKGYAGTFDKETIDQIATRSEVAYIEPNAVVVASAITTQSPISSWGLGSVSHKSGTGSNYIYDSSAGSGVYAYVVDTGVLTTHNDFGGRAVWGYNAVSGSSNTDANGHGTHVAGTIAGTTYGIAKKATIIAVKVLGDDGSGTNAGVIAGINWVASNAQSNGRTTKSVANMSLGGSYSAAVNSAVNNAVAAGITFAVAAGNDNANAANYSPASAASALTVGAITSSLVRASYSNYGSALDIFAPGSSITSTWIGSNSATNTISGTSMASPHVAGVAAYLIGLEGLSTPAAVRARIIALAGSGLVTSPGTGSPNYLLYNGNGA